MEVSMHEALEPPLSHDETYGRAVAIVLGRREASVSLVQRHLRLGYRATCALFERMQAEGLVAPATGKAKEWVLIREPHE